MFPGAGAVVYCNEAGEPLGWDYPSDDPYEAVDNFESSWLEHNPPEDEYDDEEE